MKKLAAPFLILALALAGTAWAQDDEGGGDDSGGGDTSGGGEAGGGAAATTNGGGAVETMKVYTGEKAGTLALEADVGGIDLSALISSIAATAGGTVTATDVPRAHLLYFLSPTAAADLRVGVALSHTPSGVDAMGNPTSSKTTFGLGVGVGYRMYSSMTGHVHPYLEPAVDLRIPDFSHAGDTIGLSAGAAWGIEYMFTEQFAVGTNIGAAINFTQKFKNINLATFSAGLTATFYW